MLEVAEGVGDGVGVYNPGVTGVGDAKLKYVPISL